ncbi:hypothetical protein HYW42_04075 [Candidatus Daviesbacteria bacterium]|nr:hypothetical protein [Candidatus Daviesbacteria bacterium]
MDENKLKSIIGEAIKPILDQLNNPETGLVAINGRLEGVEGRLEDPDTGLKRINDRLDTNTAAIVGLESTIKGYADSYQANDTNIRKAEKRLETLEEKARVDVPLKLQFTPPSDL